MIVGVVMMPWKLLSDYGSYIFGWLVGYSGLLGPIAGIMIADYFILTEAAPCSRRSLPARRSIRISNGVNPNALVSLACGISRRSLRPGDSRRCAGSTITPGSWDSELPA